MLTGDRIGGALNARRVVATLGLAGTLTAARRWNERTPALPAWRRPLPSARLDQTFAAPASSRGAARQMAGRAGRKNARGSDGDAGGPASHWQGRRYAPGAHRGRSVTVRSAPASSAPRIKAGEASRRSKTATSRRGMLRPGREPRRLRASNRLMRGFDQVTKERSVWRL
jgi:hypothetical protein